MYRSIVKVTILHNVYCPPGAFKFSYLYFCVIPLLIISSFIFYLYFIELVIEGSREGRGGGGVTIQLKLYIHRVKVLPVPGPL